MKPPAKTLWKYVYWMTGKKKHTLNFPMDSLLRKNMEKKTRSATVQQERCRFLLSPKSFASIRKTQKNVVPLGYRSGKNSCRLNFHVHNYLWLRPFFSQTFKGKLDGKKIQVSQNCAFLNWKSPHKSFSVQSHLIQSQTTKKMRVGDSSVHLFQSPTLLCPRLSVDGWITAFKESSQKKNLPWLINHPPPLTLPPKKIMAFYKAFFFGFPQWYRLTSSHKSCSQRGPSR